MATLSIIGGLIAAIPSFLKAFQEVLKLWIQYETAQERKAFAAELHASLQEVVTKNDTTRLSNLLSQNAEPLPRNPGS